MISSTSMLPMTEKLQYNKQRRRGARAGEEKTRDKRRRVKNREEKRREEEGQEKEKRRRVKNRAGKQLAVDEEGGGTMFYATFSMAMASSEK